MRYSRGRGGGAWAPYENKYEKCCNLCLYLCPQGSQRPVNLPGSFWPRTFALPRCPIGPHTGGTVLRCLGPLRGKCTERHFWSDRTYSVVNRRVFTHSGELQLSFKNTVPCLSCSGLRPALESPPFAPSMLICERTQLSACPPADTRKPPVIAAAHRHTVVQPAYGVRCKWMMGTCVFPIKLVCNERPVFRTSFQVPSEPSSSSSQMQGCRQKNFISKTE